MALSRMKLLRGFRDVINKLRPEEYGIPSNRNILLKLTINPLIKPQDVIPTNWKDQPEEWEKYWARWFAPLVAVLIDENLEVRRLARLAVCVAIMQKDSESKKVAEAFIESEAALGNVKRVSTGEGWEEVEELKIFYSALAGAFHNAVIDEVWLGSRRLFSQDNVMRAMAGNRNIKTVSLAFLELAHLQEGHLQGLYQLLLSPHLEKLELARTGIGYIQDEQVLRNLGIAVSRSRLAKLGLSRSSLTDYEAEAFTIIIQMLQEHSRLQELDLCECSVGRLNGDRLDQTCAALSANQELNTLYLGFNQLNAESLPKICAALMNLAKLRFLELSGNQLGQQDIATLITLIKKLSGLKKLNLSSNELGNLSAEIFHSLCEVLASSNISNLDIRDNNLGAAKIADLSSIVRHNKNLRVLDLSVNSLGDLDEENFNALFDALENSSLTHLSLAGTNLGNLNQAQMKRLCSVIMNPKLKSLDLSRNDFNKLDPEYFSQLCAAIGKSSITELRYQANNLGLITDEHFTCFCEALKNPNLKTIFLHDLDLHIALSGIDARGERYRELFTGMLQDNFYLVNFSVLYIEKVPEMCGALKRNAIIHFARKAAAEFEKNLPDVLDQDATKAEELFLSTLDAIAFALEQVQDLKSPNALTCKNELINLQHEACFQMFNTVFLACRQQGDLMRPAFFNVLEYLVFKDNDDNYQLVIPSLLDYQKLFNSYLLEVAGLKETFLSDPLSHANQVALLQFIMLNELKDRIGTASSTPSSTLFAADSDKVAAVKVLQSLPPIQKLEDLTSENLEKIQDCWHKAAKCRDALHEDCKEAALAIDNQISQLKRMEP